MCNTYCCSTTIMVARRRHIVRLYVHCLNDEATGWTGRGSNRGRDQRFMSSSKRADCLWGPQSLLLNGKRDSFPGERGLKQTRPEVNHSHSFSAGVRNEWSCTFAGPVCLHRMERNTVTLLNVNISVIHNEYLLYIHLYSTLYKI
jgi:hypothetical protein